MSFVLNNYQQISLFDSLGFLSERKQKILDKSCEKLLQTLQSAVKNKQVVRFTYTMVEKQGNIV